MTAALSSPSPLSMVASHSGSTSAGEGNIGPKLSPPMKRQGSQGAPGAASVAAAQASIVKLLFRSPALRACQIGRVWRAAIEREGNHTTASAQKMATIQGILNASNHFDLLRLPKPTSDLLGEPVWDVSEADVHRAFRKTSLCCHPDKATHADAPRAFELVSTGLVRKHSGVVDVAVSAAVGKGLGVSGSDLDAILVGLPLLHVVILRLCLKIGRTQFEEREATAFAFCASHKTLAFGLPLIRTLFEGSPDLAYYCAPIMVLHPAQLFIGSLFAPGLKERNYS